MLIFHPSLLIRLQDLGDEEGEEDEGEEEDEEDDGGEEEEDLEDEDE